jgi:hypothetical protein
LSGSQISSRRTSAKGFYDKYNGRPLPSASGGGLYTPYDPEITETNIRGQRDYHSPLFEFFAKTMGLSLGDVYGTGWFGGYNNPHPDGTSSSGGHNGIDFAGMTYGSKSPLYSTTGGTIIRAQNTSQGGGAGNNILWKDDNGYYHWYMHMNEPPLKNVGESIEPGSLLGHVGYTGHCEPSGPGGTHLHYSISKNLPGWESECDVNPLKYFSNAVAANSGSGDSDDTPPLDQSLFDDLYSNLNNNGMSTIINKYDIKSDTKKLDDILDKMGKMTFNVRAQRVEELLEELIEKVSDEKPDKPSPSNDTTDTNLFQNKPIPEQIQRLAKG